jgi:hypothetical protein
MSGGSCRLRWRPVPQVGDWDAPSLPNLPIVASPTSHRPHPASGSRPNRAPSAIPPAATNRVAGESRANSSATSGTRVSVARFAALGNDNVRTTIQGSRVCDRLHLADQLTAGSPYRGRKRCGVTERQHHTAGACASTCPSSSGCLASCSLNRSNVDRPLQGSLTSVFNWISNKPLKAKLPSAGNEMNPE